MDKKHLLAALSLMVVGASSGSASAAVDPFEKCKGLDAAAEAECACGITLDDGSVDIIKSFLDKYSDEAGATACSTLASTIDTGQPAGPNEGPGPQGGGTYN